MAERDSSRFSYRIDWRYLPLLVAFGFRPWHDAVSVREGRVRATFGWFHVETPLRNVAGAHVTTGYRWWTAPGARLSRADDGLTFGTNHEAGVCIHFTEKVPSTLRRRGHSALTVTVADLDGLLAALGPADPAP